MTAGRNVGLLAAGRIATGNTGFGSTVRAGVKVSDRVESTLPMLMRVLTLLAAVISAAPAPLVGVRFHCLITGQKDLTSCCCTGSMTTACEGESMKVPEKPACES